VAETQALGRQGAMVALAFGVKAILLYAALSVDVKAGTVVPCSSEQQRTWGWL